MRTVSRSTNVTAKKGRLSIIVQLLKQIKKWLASWQNLTLDLFHLTFRLITSARYSKPICFSHALTIQRSFFRTNTRADQLSLRQDLDRSAQRSIRNRPYLDISECKVICPSRTRYHVTFSYSHCRINLTSTRTICDLDIYSTYQPLFRLSHSSYYRRATRNSRI